MGDFDRALEVYRQKAETHPDDPELVLGQMRCLQALGEWGSVHNISEHYWDSVSVDTRNRMASMATTSAWHTHEWEAMEKYTNLLPREVSTSRDYSKIKFQYVFKCKSEIVFYRISRWRSIR